MEKKYSASFEIKEVTANKLSEFVEKVKTLTKDGREISNIVAVVVTGTTSNP